MPINGNQTVTFSFRDNLTNRELNHVYTGLFDAGVYSGLEASITTGNLTGTISITDGVMCILDDNGSGSLFKLQFDTISPFTSSNYAQPYIVCRFPFVPSISTPSRASFYCVNLASIKSTDIVLGMITFNGLSKVTGIDLSVRTNGTLPKLTNIVNGMKVVQNNGATFGVDILPGTIMNGNEATLFSTITHVTFAVPAPSAPNMRTDLIVFDKSDASIQVLNGSEYLTGTTPTPPDYAIYIVLAEVIIQSEATIIYNSDIIDVRDFFNVFPNNMSDYEAVNNISGYLGTFQVDVYYGTGAGGAPGTQGGTPAGFLWKQIYTTESSTVLVTEIYYYGVGTGGTAYDINHVTYTIKGIGYGSRTIYETFHYNADGTISSIQYT